LNNSFLPLFINFFSCAVTGTPEQPTPVDASQEIMKQKLKGIPLGPDDLYMDSIIYSDIFSPGAQPAYGAEACLVII
jgi:hypothetical protein